MPLLWGSGLAWTPGLAACVPFASQIVHRRKERPDDIKNSSIGYLEQAVGHGIDHAPGDHGGNADEQDTHILGQFLTEAAVLTGIGGLLGIGGGIGLAYAISSLSQAPVAISVPAIIVAVVFSTLIGIIFGIIPSVKAANLNPIDALRHE